jgi:hypothetical protein
MESIEANESQHADWDQVFFNKKQTVILKKNWRDFVVLIVVVFLHIIIISYWFKWQKLSSIRTDAFQEALEITFIDRIDIPEPVAAPSQATIGEESLPISSSDRDSDSEGDSDSSGMQLPLENADEVPAASLRLTLDHDEWNSSYEATERNLLKRQHIALPGRAEPFVKGITLRDELSPQKRLAMLGVMFGSAKYDPCAEARKRMANLQSQLHEIDVEADLRTMEYHCRP